ncbi:hypothetical protein [Flavihumibacter petaseus]|uniref:Lipoprotein n=1 Tax=Flavihumibacter petaseus NBRC 106054 TaxID=1220578 RepID=A0A0E9N410_9BACT|nr:hypothetical protein [Flavihumibacter petaseus]GAO44559.1 hypothetical protein FPE01S_03_05970 [Flavihumibacter petaseus NBRC 106054]
MKSRNPIPVFACLSLMVILLGSCTGSNKLLMSSIPYAQSSYHVQPTLSDSISHANYVSLAGSFNAIGRDLEDNSQLAQFKFHHAGTAGRFQYYGGLQLNAGAYNITDGLYEDSTFSEYPYRRSNFVFAGAVSFGAYYTLPVSKSFEWRILGVDGSVGYEGGKYVQYRKGLPNHLLGYVDKENFQQVYYLSTEMVFKKRRSGFKLGYQFSVGTTFRELPYDEYYNGSSSAVLNGYSTPAIVRNTLHLGNDPMYFYFQVYGSRYLLGFGTGITYRISNLR